MVNKYIPKDLKEALQILSEHDCYIMAGGTDLMVVKHRSSGLLPTFDKDVIYIMGLEELNFIKKVDGNIVIGATANYADILKSPIIPQLLKDIVIEIASPSLRNMATLVGNIGNASPAGDALVGLYLYDALIELTSVRGKRIMPISEFIYGVRRIHREKDELITSVIIPAKHFTNTKWKKVGSRKAETISKITFAGSYILDKGIIKDIRLVFGSVGITVVRRPELETKYIGLSVEQLKSKIDEILSEYGNFVLPISDQRSTKDYRYKVAMNIARDFLSHIE
ncbi:MAG TPA: FAD binding domain-containing protein [Bacilli bacterium]|nr:FAD binding domain-containing protein [Bacilli bacterium]